MTVLTASPEKGNERLFHLNAYGHTDDGAPARIRLHDSQLPEYDTGESPLRVFSSADVVLPHTSEEYVTALVVRIGNPAAARALAEMLTAAAERLDETATLAELVEMGREF